LSVFFSTCKGCGCDLALENEDIICRDCREKIVICREPRCSVCGRLMFNGAGRCGDCIVNPPPFRKHISYARYRGLLKDLILLYKYGQIEKLKYLFADLVLQSIYEKLDESFDYIVPVPPDKGRKREFSPILEISKILSERMGIGLLPGHLIKVKQTPPQAGLGKVKRVRNLDGAFKLTHPEDIKGKKILLVDDVYTTGTTVNKCAWLLKKQAEDVVAVTLAHS
jgi:competence protein ComFC